MRGGSSPRWNANFLSRSAAEPNLQRLGPTWKDFSKAMLIIRKQGYCVSAGELDPGKTGLAAPIFDEKSRILGAVTLVGSNERFDAFSQDYLVKQITEAASTITARIAAEQPTT